VSSRNFRKPLCSPRILSAVLLGLLFSTTAWAISAQADRKILEGLETAYDLDFLRAATLFREADRLEPEHPAAPFFLASLCWFEFSQNADVPGTIDALEPQFNELMGEAFARAWRIYKRNRKDPEANFYLGAAYGMKGRWQLLKRQWIRAAANGYKGYKYLRRAVELDPQFYDAYLGLGMYDYYSDTLPRVLKLASMLIVRGDKKRGLRFVQLTTEKGHYSVMEAKLFLAGVYAGYEHEPQKALGIIHELRRERPDNLFLSSMEVLIRIDAKDWDGAIALAENLLPRVIEVPYARPHISLFRLYLGEAYLGAREYEKAIEIFKTCIEQALEARKASVTFCYLRRAQAYDLLGRREDALRDYRVVQARPDFFDSEQKGRRGLRSPRSYEQVLAELFE
jgi:tetratricopeptide (TPR) repeat protein